MSKPDLLSATDSLFFSQTGMDRGQTERLVSQALHGADDGELYLEYCQSENLLWDDGKLRNASYSVMQGFGLRAVVGEAVGLAHATRFDAETLKKAISSVQIVKNGNSGTVDISPPPTTLSLYPSIDPIAGRPFADKIALLQQADAYIRALDPRIYQVSVSLSASWQAVQIIRDGGWRGADIRPLIRLNISLSVRDGDKMESASSGFGGREGYERIFDPAQWQKTGREALRKALAGLDAIEAPAGEMTVVLGPGWPAVLLHEAIGHGLEGDFNRQKTSAFAGLMGQKIAARGVTVVDDGTLGGKRGSLSMDDEGTPTQCTPLIEDGVLTGYMQDRLNGRLMGEKSTGNGRRESFACQPYPRMTNTIMRSGPYDPAEIIASVKKGVYAADFGGGQVEITSGKFVFSATEAYQIVDGKLGRPLKGASLVGTGFESLKQISMVGNDSTLDGGIGTCGKHGQGVPVGVGQPTLKLDRMTVGGRG